MNTLLALIMAIFSYTTFPKEERSVTKCEDGGFYLNNHVNIALCWGDDRATVNHYMHEMGYVEAHQYPVSGDGLNFQAGKVLGYSINFIFLNFQSDSLVDMNVGYYFTDNDMNYNNMNRLYNRLRKYFIDNDYVVEKESGNKVFDREFGSCDGDCGMIPFNGELLDMELVAFLTGHAEQYTNFKDDEANVELNIGVMKWNYYNDITDSTYTIRTTYPIVGLNISSPKLIKNLKTDRNIRRRK